MTIELDAVVKRLSENTKIHQDNFEKNQIIYRANQIANGFYLLDSGMVGLYKNTEAGKEHLIRVYGKGEFFGYRSLFSQEAYHLTTRSLTPSNVYHIHISRIEDLYQNTPDLLNFLVKSVCRELGEAESRLSNVAGFGAKIRVLDSIIDLFGRFSDYPWTAREIAEFSGTEAQTVIRFCRLLKDKGLLDPNIRGIAPVNLHNLSQFRAKLVSD
ncbi:MULTISPECIES: Crp/Fnr family transcriptional regulator [unclassified Vibrio]|uniref:Crp/Fnr family transcriptional regulator n=1 Tax=unclassified Vibrio TaxID=2614977 RepID=UPI00189DA9F4|nr:Crp/Fnr family transcriptional regulator [Vibrio sp. VB16]UGA57142.1 Crp/Fnr family transcriptional regulator [Vibrio sp. VB16]